VSNREFLQAIFGDKAGKAIVCGFAGDPANPPPGAWGCTHFDKARLRRRDNQYYCVSLFDSPGRRPRRKAEYFAGCYVVGLDDVGEKLDADFASRLPAPSAVLETSKGSEQWLYFLSEPCTNKARFDYLHDTLIASGLAPDGTDPGQKGVTRYLRLPEGANHKPAKMVGGKPFATLVKVWEPDRRYTVERIAEALSADLDAAPAARSHKPGMHDPEHPLWDVLPPRSRPKPDGWADVDCPWSSDHTKGDSGAAAVTHADGSFAFKCHHGHCSDKDADKVRQWMRETNPPAFADLTQYEEAKQAEVAATMVAEAFAGIESEPPRVPSVVVPLREGDALSAPERRVADRPLFTPVSEFVAAARPPEWLVRGYLERRATTFLIGAPGSGKSWVALGWAASVATGTPWLGHHSEPGRVAYLAGEGKAGMQRRLAAWYQHANAPMSGSLIVSERGAALDDPDELAIVRSALRAFCGEGGGLDLLVVDTMARCFSGDENSAKDAGAFLRGVESLALEFRCAVVVVHHVGHGDGERARGSSALRGAADAEYLVRLDKADVRTITNNKMKDGPPPRQVAFALEDYTCALPSGVMADSAVVAPAELPVKPVALPAKARLLVEAIKSAGASAEWNEVRDKFLELHDAERDAKGSARDPHRKRAFGRAKDALLERLGAKDDSDPWELALAADPFM
jgi:hypothetical protein